MEPGEDLSVLTQSDELFSMIGEIGIYLETILTYPVGKETSKLCWNTLVVERLLPVWRIARNRNDDERKDDARLLASKIIKLMCREMESTLGDEYASHSTNEAGRQKIYKILDRNLQQLTEAGQILESVSLLCAWSAFLNRALGQIPSRSELLQLGDRVLFVAESDRPSYKDL